MDLYNTISEEPQIPRFSYYSPVYPSSLLTPQDNRFLDDADTVMSFANISKLQSNLELKLCVRAEWPGEPQCLIQISQFTDVFLEV